MISEEELIAGRQGDVENMFALFQKGQPVLLSDLILAIRLAMRHRRHPDVAEKLVSRTIRNLIKSKQGHTNGQHYVPGQFQLPLRNYLSTYPDSLK
jgi:hypothetical protein